MSRPLSSIEEFGQRVLQQRQRSGAIGNVSHQLRDERRFERHAERFHRADDRSLDLLGRHRRDHLGALAQEFAESAMLQRPIVEIGAQRDDHVRCRLSSSMTALTSASMNRSAASASAWVNNSSN